LTLWLGSFVLVFRISSSIVPITIKWTWKVAFTALDRWLSLEHAPVLR
jgi:hypothetical protein